MIYAARLAEVRRRKARLIAGCAVERAAFAAQLDAWRTTIEVLDRGIAAARYVRAHPALVAAVFATVAVLGRRKLLRWTGRGLVLWRAWRTVKFLAGTHGT